MIQAGSALSLVCASMMRGLRSQDRFVSMVFFCRQHIESDDISAGPTAMLRSLIAQLLRQQFTGHIVRKQEVGLEGLRSWDIDVLCLLFKWLVGSFLQPKTLVCVVDGSEAYATTMDEDDLHKVMVCLLGIEREPSLVLFAKVLVTSTEAVSVEQDFKKNDSRVLLIQGVLSGGDEEDREDSLQYLS